MQAFGVGGVGGQGAREARSEEGKALGFGIGWGFQTANGSSLSLWPVLGARKKLLIAIVDAVRRAMPEFMPARSRRTVRRRRDIFSGEWGGRVMLR